MKILFISRAYPPVTGGIENQNHALSVWLPKYAETTTIANHYGKKFLPFFLPYAIVIALWKMRHFDVLLLGDGVLGIVGFFTKIVYPKKPVVSVLHGLDLTYSLSLYQSLWVKQFLPKLDAYIAVGNETIKVGTAHGLPENKFFFIPNGVNPEKHLGEYSRKDLERILGRNLTDKKVLLTSGRLAKRKGVAWFIGHVLPFLPEHVLYAVAGGGPDRENILIAIRKSNMTDRVIFLGYVDDTTRDTLFNTADLFIQPNIPVENDIEGFGLTVLEATTCRLPVVASRLEGLQDAIKDGENGFLIEPENAPAYVAKINELLTLDPQTRQELGEHVREYVVKQYAWSSIAGDYAALLEKIANPERITKK